MQDEKPAFGGACDQGNLACECTKRHGLKRLGGWSYDFDWWLLSDSSVFGALKWCKGVAHERKKRSTGESRGM